VTSSSAAEQQRCSPAETSLRRGSRHIRTSVLPPTRWDGVPSGFLGHGFARPEPAKPEQPPDKRVIRAHAWCFLVCKRSGGTFIGHLVCMRCRAHPRSPHVAGCWRRACTECPRPCRSGCERRCAPDLGPLLQMMRLTGHLRFSLAPFGRGGRNLRPPHRSIRTTGSSSRDRSGCRRSWCSTPGCLPGGHR